MSEVRDLACLECGGPESLCEGCHQANDMQGHVARFLAGLDGERAARAALHPLRLAMAQAVWLEPLHAGGFRVWCPPALGDHRPRVLTAAGTWSPHVPARRRFDTAQEAHDAVAIASPWWGKEDTLGPK